MMNRHGLSDSLDPAIFHSVLLLTRKHHHIQKLHIADLLKTVNGMLGKIEKLLQLY